MKIIMIVLILYFLIIILTSELYLIQAILKKGKSFSEVKQILLFPIIPIYQMIMKHIIYISDLIIQLQNLMQKLFMRI